MNSIASWPLRVYVAAMFLMAGVLKITFGVHAPEWFQGLDFPFPQNLLPADLNWVLAGWGETIFALLLLTPLGGWAAAGLLYITFVAVYTSHFDMGWAGWNDPEDGFKIPLMYAVMTLSVLLGQIPTMKKQVSKVWKKIKASA